MPITWGHFKLCTCCTTIIPIIISLVWSLQHGNIVQQDKVHLRLHTVYTMCAVTGIKVLQKTTAYFRFVRLACCLIKVNDWIFIAGCFTALMSLFSQSGIPCWVSSFHQCLRPPHAPWLPVLDWCNWLGDWAEKTPSAECPSPPVWIKY